MSITWGLSLETVNINSGEVFMGRHSKLWLDRYMWMDGYQSSRGEGVPDSSFFLGHTPTTCFTRRSKKKLQGKRTSECPNRVIPM